jgi:hypothetical protein
MILTLIAGDSGVDPDPYKIFYFDTDLRFETEYGSYPKTSVVDPDPVGSGTFCRIRIRNK